MENIFLQVWKPLPMADTLENIYVLLFIWFIMWGILKLLSYMTNSSKRWER